MIRVELALARTDSPALDAEAYAALFPPERWESLRRSVPSVRRESVAGRLLLRALLTEHRPDLPLPPRLAYGAAGKPRLRDAPELHFNLSHSEGWAVCALTSVPVGVDIQRNRHIRPSIARRFAPSERALLERTPEPERGAALCALWTLKEAWCKCTGAGLTLPLDSASFTLDPPTIDRRGYRVLRPAGPEPDWYLALCLETEEEVRLARRVVAP